MGHGLSIGALFPQCQALVDAEAVLFVDDRQRQAVEDHLLLEERVGADHQRAVTAGQLRQNRLLLLRPGLAREPPRLNTQRRQPIPEAQVMLLGEDLRGRHQGDLGTGLDGLQRGDGGHNCLARSHVTLHQAQHGYRLRQVMTDLPGHPPLRAGEFERQSIQEPGHQPTIPAVERQRLPGLDLRPQPEKTEMVGQQFLHHQAVPRRMALLHESAEIRTGRGPMQHPQGLVDLGKLVLAEHRFRQPFVHRMAIQHGHGLLAQAPQPGLLDALGERVDRRQRGLVPGRQRAGIDLVFRVVDLKAGAAGPDLAEAAHPRPRRELALLGGTEMEKPQGHETTAVTEGHLETAAPALDHVRAYHLPFKDTGIPHPHLTHRQDTGAILVTQGQVEQQILEAGDTEALKGGGQLTADPLEHGHIHCGRVRHISSVWARAGSGRISHPCRCYPGTGQRRGPARQWPWAAGRLHAMPGRRSGRAPGPQRAERPAGPADNSPPSPPTAAIR